jgi:5-formyltetrahydrofolate cyclo-ligase
LVLPTIKSFSFFFFFRGKGYYDTYLAKARTVGLDPKAIGLSFKQQIVDDIPTTTNDVLIDRVLTSD